MNKVEITGKIYNIKTSTTLSGKRISRFGLSIYTGKGKDGKAQYGFVDCKYFGDIMASDSLKDVVGKLTVDSWEKDGKKYSKPEIIVESIVDSTMFSGSAPKKKDEGVPFDDDELGAVFG